MMSAGFRIFAVIAVLVIVGALISPSNYYFRVGTLLWINAVSVIGMVVLLGYVGLVSLGHAGFFAIGAYSVVVLPNYGLPPLAAAPVGVALAGLVAYVIGRPILKLSGYYLAIATLGFGILVWMVLTKEAWLTGGPDGGPVAGPNPKYLFRAIGIDMTTAEAWYWICGLVAAIGGGLIANLGQSPTGRAMRALHDSDVAAQSLGVDSARAKSVAFIISALYAATAGVLLSFANGYITPEVGGFMHSVEMVTMAVLGGASSVIGALVGVFLLTVLPQVLTIFAEYEHMILGAIMVLTMVLMRDGLMPAFLNLFKRLGRKS